MLSYQIEVLTPDSDLIASLGLEEIGREAITEASALLLNRTRTRFLAQESPDGVGWEPSFAAFQRSFGIGRNGGGTLFDSGNLFNSIQLYSISPLEQAIGTDVFYGVFHQEGTAKLPQRQFLGFSEEDEDLAIRVLLSKLSEAYPQ